MDWVDMLLGPSNNEVATTCGFKRLSSLISSRFESLDSTSDQGSLFTATMLVLIRARPSRAWKTWQLNSECSFKGYGKDIQLDLSSSSAIAWAVY
ncbi:hypothetical protein FOIG_16267 [Fusarium odoratissimum NRRL 54006]|uniref:Uncharacterized protein n=1 Tax=Fusarium odoratissimum (strain NRRL 54006) TaxID=1089451 RepID=X0INR8_FUSO5|nr:uncharacterized protein FOIG_16267 [Fusarium odoratissimum NRRL 54006]EXL90497.1 hypothetical protein FOIG_16267 [Fusarium odoratissimum NRRL 54006]